MGLPSGYNAGSAVMRLILDWSSVAEGERAIPTALNTMAEAASKWGKDVRAATRDSSAAMEEYSNGINTVIKMFENLNRATNIGELPAQLQDVILAFSVLEKQAENIKDLPKPFRELVNQLERAEKAGSLSSVLVSKEDVTNLSRAYAWEMKIRQQLEDQRNANNQINIAYRRRSLELENQQKLQQRILQLEANLATQLNAGNINRQQYSQLMAQVPKAAAAGFQIPDLPRTTQQASSLLSVLRGVGGALASVAAGFGIFLSIQAVISGITRTMQRLVRHTIDYFDAMKTAKTFMIGFAGGIQEAERSMANLLQYARATRMPFRDAVGSAQELAPVLAAAGESIERLPYYLDVARKLAVLNQGSTGGVSGAIFSIGELLSGDVRSIQRRFRVNPETLKQIAKEQGLTYIEALDYFLTNELNITDEIVEESLRNWADSWERLGDAIGYVGERAFGPLIDKYILPLIDHMTALVFKVGDFLDVMNKTGAGIGGFAQMAISQAEAFWGMDAAQIGSVIKEFLTKLGESFLAYLAGVAVIRAAFFSFVSEFRAFLMDAVSALASLASSIFGLLARVSSTLGMNRQAEGFTNMAAAMNEVAATATEAAEKQRQAGKDQAQASLDYVMSLRQAHYALFRDIPRSERRFAQGYQGRYTGGVGRVDEGPSDSDLFPDDAVEAYADYLETLADKQADFNQQTRQMEEDHQRDMLQKREDYYRDMERAEEEFIRQQKRAEADFYDDYNDLLAGRTGEAHDLLKKVNEQREAAQKEHNDETLRLEEDFRKKLRRMEEDHTLSVLESAARLDARSVYEERRRYAQEVRQAHEDFNDKMSRRQQEFDAEYNVESEAFQQRLELAKQHDRERAAQMLEEFRLRQQREREDFNIRMRQRAADFNEEMRRAAEEHRIKMNRRSTEFQTELSRMERELAQEINAILKANNSAMAIHADGMDNVRTMLIRWWKENGHLYIPPEERKWKRDKEGNITGIEGIPGRFALGGIVPHTGYHLLHMGERVLNPEQTKAFDSLFVRGGITDLMNGMVAAATMRGGMGIPASGNTISVTNHFHNVGEKSPAELERVVETALQNVLKGY